MLLSPQAGALPCSMQRRLCNPLYSATIRTTTFTHIIHQATTHMEHKLAEIGQIAVTVSDVARALPFYRDVLGLAFLFSPSPTLAFLAAGSVRIMLSTAQGTATAGNSILYFKVTDIHQVFSAVIARGAHCERQPQLTATLPDHELWIGFLRDPDGNLIGVMEEKYPQR